MVCVENRTISDVLHKDLTSCDPWGDVCGGRFVGVFTLDIGMGVNQGDVCVYHFNVCSLVDDFISQHSISGKVFDDGDTEAIENAETMIAELKLMIDKLQRACPKG